MRENQDPIKKIDDIRSMMERSSKFLSLSGWAGIMAGIYALAAVWIAYSALDFNPGTIAAGSRPEGLTEIVILGLFVLTLALVTAAEFSRRKAAKKGEKIWNSTSRRLLANMAVPLVTGGILTLVLIFKGFIGLAAPLTLIFYGLALYNAGRFTIDAVKFLGMAQIGLGLLSSVFIEYGIWFWAAGFGMAHIVYGIYMHIRYER